MFEIGLGDTVITKKSHPCGGFEWECVRTGADIKLKCKTCGHVVMLDREECRKRTKSIIKAGDLSHG